MKISFLELSSSSCLVTVSLLKLYCLKMPMVPVSSTSSETRRRLISPDTIKDQSITWGWGIGVMLGVYSSGISGAHLK